MMRIKKNIYLGIVTNSWSNTKILHTNILRTVLQMKQQITREILVAERLY